MTDAGLSVQDGGFTLRVRLTPGAAHDRVDGAAVGADGARFLAVRVRAKPEKGRANAALEEVLAAAIGAPKSAVTVQRGMTARMKTVHIAGGEEARLAARRLFEKKDEGGKA